MSSIHIIAQAAGTPAAAETSIPAAPTAPAAATPPPTQGTPGTTQPADNKPAAPAPSGYQQYSGLITFALLAVVFYMLLIRPQRKAQKEQQARINALQTGDQVVTNAGLHGAIRKVGETTVDVEIAPGVIVTLEKAAIVNVKK